MANETMKHLRCWGGCLHVRSECGKRYPAVKSNDLTGHISKSECRECLEERHKKIVQDLVDCVIRLDEIG